MKLTHDTLSTIQCSHPGCTKLIKQRLINLSDRFTKCYYHHCQEEAGRGHYVNTSQRRKRVLSGLPVKANLLTPEIN